MRTLPAATNTPLRESLDDEDDVVVPMLLASTLAVTHDGTLVPEEDGTLPKGEALPLGISRAADGSYLIGAYTDPLAISEPAAPTQGVRTPCVPITGDDLAMLAAANHVGIHVNPGSVEQRVIDAPTVRTIAAGLREQRAQAGVRMFDDRTMLVTMRGYDPQLDEHRSAVLVRELAARGARLAFIAEYALHGEGDDPDQFTQILVVGDEDGFADYDLRESTRRTLAFLTGRSTDSVAYSAMTQVRHVARPLLQGDGPLPTPLVGVV